MCLQAKFEGLSIRNGPSSLNTKKVKRYEQFSGQHKSQQIPLEKCVNGRAGRAPRCMGAFVVNETVASETPQQSMSLKCVPVKHESNTQTSEIDHSDGES